MKLGRLLEFFIVGMGLGIIEDLIAIGLATGATITWHIVGIIALVSLPFAVISELIVDHFKPFHKKNKKRRK
ncbi:MAG: hypothetical protein IB618_04155 [Candidatus Pacearchaeota archaeon]|nr:MAG: hypothetical protein IB618_04155 [Candidatus Pacearchaeota archaeon]